MERVIKILKIQDVEKMIGLKKSAIYAMIEKGEFPAQIQLGARSVGWIEFEVQDWLVERFHASRNFSAKPNDANQ